MLVGILEIVRLARSSAVKFDPFRQSRKVSTIHGSENGDSGVADILLKCEQGRLESRQQYAYKLEQRQR